MTVSLVLGISILLQGTAAILALLLIPLTRKALAWIFFSVAFFLMTIRRLLSFLIQQGVISPDMLAYVHPEWVALGISVLMVGGVYHFRYFFQQRQRAEEALRESEDRYALACRGTNDGIWDWDIRGQKIYYSSRWKSILGYGDDDTEIDNQPSSWFERVHPAEREALNKTLAQHLSGQTTHFRHEHRMLHKNGSYRWVVTRATAVWDKDGKPIRLAGSQTDITPRKQVEQKILHDAYHDALTGLPNRAWFLEQLEGSAKKADDNPGYEYAVLFLDLDRFKIINDSLGHSIGDRMITTVADLLKSWAPVNATVARFGGDEFAILVKGVRDITVIRQYAKEVRQLLAKPMQLDGYEAQTTVSIGIASSILQRDTPEHVLRDADTAMYRAKELGKDRYEFFNHSMHDEAVSRLELESTLRQAISRNELQLYYQPIVAIESEKLIGVEALLRWSHPDLGLISPVRFISVAEETGLIIPIGEWVLKNACQQLKQWIDDEPDALGLSVSVNISSLQLSQKDFSERVIEIVQDCGLSGQHIRLEITESALLYNVQSAMEIFQKLREFGIRFYLDDFGTGYSSLSYLIRYPLDGLKIDRSFIQNMDQENERPEVVSAIIDLANNLDLDVIAEGVEALEQSKQLIRLKCEYAQGYHYSRPIPGKDVIGMINATVDRS